MPQTKLVKSIRENTRNYAGSKGALYVHMITLAEPIMVDGESTDALEYHSQSTTCEKFVAGKEATFETEKKTNGKFTNFKIKPVAQQANTYTGGNASFAPKSRGNYQAKDSEVISALSCASSAAQFYQQRDAQVKDVLAMAEELYQWANSKSKAQ